MRGGEREEQSLMNATGLPIGREVDPSPAELPQRVVMEGRYVWLVPLDPKVHGDALWEGTGGSQHERLWHYLFEGPFLERSAFDAHLQEKAASGDPMFFAIVDKAAKRAGGYAAFMRMAPCHRSIEVGSILYSPAMQRTRGATEAMYLMGRHIFEDLGY